jgi:hypothetical protein
MNLLGRTIIFGIGVLPRSKAQYSNVTKKQTTKRSKTKMTQNNSDVIFVGNKPPMSYVLAIITNLSAGNLKEITVVS